MDDKYKKSLEMAILCFDNTSCSASLNKDEIYNLLCHIFPEFQTIYKDDLYRKMAIKAVMSPESQKCIMSWHINPDDVVKWLQSLKFEHKINESCGESYNS